MKKTVEPNRSEKLVLSLRASAERLHLVYAEVAVLAGVSLPTAQHVIRDGRLPRDARCVRGLTLLAQRAAAARSRADLGLPS
jgi:hypothetical protein